MCRDLGVSLGSEQGNWLKDRLITLGSLGATSGAKLLETACLFSHCIYVAWRSIVKAYA